MRQKKFMIELELELKLRVFFRVIDPVYNNSSCQSSTSAPLERRTMSKREIDGELEKPITNLLTWAKLFP